MDPALSHLLGDALWLALLLSGPPAAAAWAAGAATAMLADRIGARDVTLTAFPRIFAAMATIAATAPWMADHALSFGRAAFGAALGLPAGG